MKGDSAFKKKKIIKFSTTNCNLVTLLLGIRISHYVLVPLDLTPCLSEQATLSNHSAFRYGFH